MLRPEAKPTADIRKSRGRGWEVAGRSVEVSCVERKPAAKPQGVAHTHKNQDHEAREKNNDLLSQKY